MLDWIGLLKPEYRLSRALAAGAVLLFCFGWSSPLEAQPTIHHDEVHCIPREEFTQFLAQIEPPESIRSAKIYFRSSLYPEYYFVEMSPGTDNFSGILPRPSEETRRVLYYIEAVDNSFETARSREFEIDVSSGADCRRGPGAIAFLGSNPAIVIGAVRAGVPALPAGFQASGIAGFLSAAGGVTAAGGSGIGVGVAIGAAAGAAAGVGVLVAGGDEEPADTTGPATSSVPVAVTTTTTPAETGTGTSTPPEPPPPGPSTTTVPGAPPPEPPPETTTTTTVPALPSACFSWEDGGACKVHFDARCSGGEMLSYEWTMLGPPVPPPPSSAEFTFDFAADPRCGDPNPFNRPVRLRVVDGLGRSDTVQHNVWVPQSLALRTASPSIVLATQLFGPPTSEVLRGWITIDGSVPMPATSASRSEYDVSASSSGATVEAVVASRVPPGTLWELDFGRGEVSSLIFSVEAGTAVAVERRRIVFRMNGDEAERIRFRFEAR